MEGRKENIFTSFRGPGVRDSEDNLGTQLEDNTTKAFLHVIDHADSEIETALLDLLSGGILSDQVATTDESAFVTDVETRTQVEIRDIDQEGAELIFTGISDQGVDPVQAEDAVQVDPDDASQSRKRVDSVIYFETEDGDTYAIVEESKFGGSSLELSDTAHYQQTLEIPDERYHIFSWLDIYECLEEALDGNTRLDAAEEPAQRRATFIAEEFMRYLRTYGLSVTTSESRYGEDNNGVNAVTLKFQPEMNVETKEVEQQPAEYALHFEVLGKNGYLDFYTAPAEWRALITDLKDTHEEAWECLRDGDSEGFFNYIDNNLNPSGREKIAEIGDEETGRKWMQVVPKDGYTVLGFKYAKPGKNEAPGGYFMIRDDELSTHFGESDGEGDTGAFQSLFEVDSDIRDLR